MTRKHFLHSLFGTSLLALAVSPAVAQTQTFVDLQAGLGYATNPLMRLGDDVGSGFARISAYGFHGWTTERSSTSLSAYVANDAYFRRYGNRQLFDLGANTSSQVSETVRLYGNLGFSGDFGAQLSSRFYGAPADTVPVLPNVTDNSGLVIIPDLAALNRRQYRITGMGGASFVLSPRETLSTSVGAQRVFFSGNGDELDYNLYDTSLAYGRQLNERASVGVRFIASYADYRAGRSIFSYGPQVIGDLKLNENLQLRGALGFVRTERDLGVLGGKDGSTDLAFDASLCRSVEYERLCAGIARRTQSSVLGAAPNTSTLNVDYSRRLNARDQFQTSFAIVTTDEARDVNLGRQTFYTLAGSFDRKINDRLSAGVSLAARKLTSTGPDPKEDIQGSIFIRNRFGSVR
jgi:hypothetical protein